VFYRGPVPDAFQDNSEIVAKGAIVRASTQGQPFGIRADGEQPAVLEATSVTAKCPAHYDEQPPTAGSAKF
jgi:cytochrome c-type biogenesis protein CcmE